IRFRRYPNLMLKLEDRMEIELLYRMKHSIRSISTITRHDRKSVRNVLREPSWHPGEGLIGAKSDNSRKSFRNPTASASHSGRPGKLKRFEPFLLDEISGKPVHPPHLLWELRQRGFTGSRYALQRFLRAHKAMVISRKQKMHDWMHMVLQGAITSSEMRREFGRRLSEENIAVLLNYVRTKPLKLRNRALSILAHLKGATCREIAAFLCLYRKTVGSYLTAFSTGGVQRVLNLSRNEIKKADDPKFIEAVFTVLHTPPSAYGFNRTTWRMCDLQTTLARAGKKIATINIRAIIKNAGYKFRKAKKVLTSTDPEYRKKLEQITFILSRLKADEKFFSIDEFGPFSVKMHGGRALTMPGQNRSIPQYQKSKGTLIVTAALELSTNQITHFYSAKKNTEEMIRMLDTLLNQYRGQRKVYFSWDAASWHASKKFFNRVGEANAPDYRVLHGTPQIELAPLPSSAQFLNLNDSVFSGLARVIIHNSDYQSVERCKQAIDRYFAERNAHFQKYPHKAGKKIWGKERVIAEFSPSNNCKDPRW